MPALDVTDATFQVDILDRSMAVPVVVDLWAPWCGPCRTLGPIIESVVGATEGAVALAKVNIDENPKIASTFQVQSIPAVFAIDQGKIVDQFIGALRGVHDLLDDRTKRPARAAPRRPEVDENGDGHRPVEDVHLEGGVADVEGRHGFARYRQCTDPCQATKYFAFGW